jgi:transposase
VSELGPSPTQAPLPPRSRGATRQAWIERLQRFADAGLSPAQFCASEGVSLPSFYSWKRRLAADVPGTDTPATDAPSPLLLPLDLRPLPPPVELVLPTGVVVRLPPGAEEATLRTLFRLLGVPSC